MTSSGANEAGRHRRAVAGLTWAQIVSTLIVVVMALGTIAIGSSLLTAISGDVYTAPLQVDLEPALVDAEMPAGATAEAVTAEVVVEAPLGQRLLWWAVTDGLGLIWLPWLELLRRVLRSQQDPFTAVNIGRLRIMAALPLLYFIGTIARAALEVGLELDAGFDNSSGYATFWPLVLTFLILTLTEVWDRGAELQTDSDFTV